MRRCRARDVGGSYMPHRALSVACLSLPSLVTCDYLPPPPALLTGGPAGAVGSGTAAPRPPYLPASRPTGVSLPSRPSLPSTAGNAGGLVGSGGVVFRPGASGSGGPGSGGAVLGGPRSRRLGDLASSLDGFTSIMNVCTSVLPTNNVRTMVGAYPVTQAGAPAVVPASAVPPAAVVPFRPRLCAGLTQRHARRSGGGAGGGGGSGVVQWPFRGEINPSYGNEIVKAFAGARKLLPVDAVKVTVPYDGDGVSDVVAAGTAVGDGDAAGGTVEGAAPAAVVPSGPAVPSAASASDGQPPSDAHAVGDSVNAVDSHVAVGASTDGTASAGAGAESVPVRGGAANGATTAATAAAGGDDEQTTADGAVAAAGVATGTGAAAAAQEEVVTEPAWRHTAASLFPHKAGVVLQCSGPTALEQGHPRRLVLTGVQE